MTIAANPGGTASEPATFGSGGGEPYARALRQDGQVLYLREDQSDTRAADRAPMHVARWSADADDADRSLLENVTGPLLDIGCGPGRMVKAATNAGMTALGIDVSPTAVQIAAESGLSVLHRSVFDRLPRAGAWNSALLIDGNIGIGGDPAALLARCRELLAPGGALLIESHSDADRDHSYDCTVADAHGRRSAPFPWAELGSTALTALAQNVGFDVVQAWVRDGRSFCRLERR